MKDDKIKASVIIPTKNAGEGFERILSTVLSQDTPWLYEVIVIDSGSKDGTQEIAERLGARLIKIPSSEFGHGRTRNRGIEESEGEFAVLLTHDALPCDSDWLKNLVDSVEKDPDIAGSFGRHYAYAESGPLVMRDLNLHFNNFASQGSVYQIDDQQRYAADQGYRQFLHFFSDNNACLRKSVWREFPYPDVNFAEDQIWAKTVLEAGYKKAYADNAAVFHSHSYGLIELFRRSFDESRALFNLFGYSLGSKLLLIPINAMRLALVDIKFLKEQRALSSNKRLAFSSFFLNFAKLLGHYMGSTKLKNSWLGDFISLDSSLKKK